ncbi:MAG: hypothetical protein LC808_05970 [Actinobacteria bacterium]|nr:hypothetical protein [Actinomycetota bacterium]
MTSEATEWLGLHRAHEGGVTKLAGHYLNYGRPGGSYLAEVFDGLISAGFLALGQPSPSGQQQVCVTHKGQTRYAELDTASR